MKNLMKSCLNTIIVLTVIIFLSLAIRAYFLILPQPIPSDSFEYVTIAQHMVEKLEYPQTKRLPFFPVVLLPAVLLLNDVEHLLWAERWISVASSILTLILLYLIGRELKLEKKTLYVAMILCSIQPYYLITSIRPLSESFYTLMAMLTVYLFYKAKDTKTHILLGFAAGLTAMTRFEGMPLAMIILAATLFRGPKKFTTTLIPIILVILPWLSHNLTTYGNPFYTEYSRDEGLNVAYTTQKLQENIQMVLDQTLKMWITEEDFFMILANFFVLLGVVLFLKHTKFRGALVILYLITAFMVMILIAYGPRLMVPSVPFMALLFAEGLFSIKIFDRLFKEKNLTEVTSSALVILFAILFFHQSLATSLGAISKHSVMGYRQRLEESTFTFDNINQTARYVKLSLGDRSEMKAKSMRLDEVEIYSNSSQESLTHTIDGIYWYDCKKIRGSYRYLTESPNHGDGGGDELIFDVGALTDGCIRESFEDSVQWDESGGHKIMFNFSREYNITRLKLIYYAGMDVGISEGVIHSSHDGVNWTEKTRFSDQTEHTRDERVTKTLFLGNAGAKYLMLRLSNTLPKLKLAEVEVETEDDFHFTCSDFVPNRERDIREGLVIVPFGEGPLTDGETHGQSGSGVVWDERNSRSTEILFDLKKEYNIEKITVVFRLRDRDFGIPMSTVGLSIDDVEYFEVGKIPEKNYDDVEVGNPLLPVWMQKIPPKEHELEISPQEHELTSLSFRDGCIIGCNENGNPLEYDEMWGWDNPYRRYICRLDETCLGVWRIPINSTENRILEVECHTGMQGRGFAVSLDNRTWVHVCNQTKEEFKWEKTGLSVGWYLKNDTVLVYLLHENTTRDKSEPLVYGFRLSENTQT